MCCQNTCVVSFFANTRHQSTAGSRCRDVESIPGLLSAESGLVRALVVCVGVGVAGRGVNGETAGEDVHD